MKLPLSWLKEYIPTKLSLEQISDTLTNLGLEVEGAHDSVLEISLTPNLSHCISVRGVARELAAVVDESVHTPECRIVENKGDSIQKYVTVNVENKERAPRYACRLIHNVRVAPSPPWLQEKIELCGMRSVNNVVDITNYVLLELGQPLHAFDFDKIEGRKIHVRNANLGESIKALDGKTYFPTQDTLLICDEKGPVALAGIMGSQESEVGEATKSVLVEAAYFAPTQIRKAAKRMGIRSEASYRFERGVDPNGVLEALDRAVSMICALAGGEVCEGMVDIKDKDFLPKELSCRLSRANQLLGTHLAMSEVETLFQRLNFTEIKIQGDLITAKIPTYRHDISQEIDLIEEIARIYGYDNIHKKEAPLFRSGTLPHSAEYLFEKKVRTRMIAEGLQEFLTCDLISPSQASWISKEDFPSRTLIKLLNPHSMEHSIMRPSLFPGMLSTIKYNADHGIHSVAGFEVGRVHFTSKEKFFEPMVASIILTGRLEKPHWENKEKGVDFFDLKGILLNVFEGLKLPKPHFKKSSYANFHPGRQAEILIENIEVGMMGEVHPLTLKEADLNQSVLFAELNMEELRNLVEKNIKMTPLATYPASARDWTITVQSQVEVGHIEALIAATKGPLLEEVTLLDLYINDKLGLDKKNITFRFIYRDLHKTISQAEVEEEHNRLTNKIKEQLVNY